ncbi:MAG: DNA mismatch repair protein MutS [Cycloclasticus sp.]|nr:MAG: DNA mismatch repair protein MutS [Cycloclasticus sp.]
MPEDKNKRPSSNNDSDLFKQSMGDVKPLNSDNQNTLDNKPKPKPIKKHFSEQSAHNEITCESTNNIQSDDILFYAQHGIQNKTIRQLKRGAIPIDDKVDLHGLNKQEATNMLQEFLAYQIEQRQRCILLIHGKGIGSLNNRPTLKNLVFNILKNEPTVLAFSSAQARDGGTGALYVLLKRLL